MREWSWNVRGWVVVVVFFEIATEVELLLERDGYWDIRKKMDIRMRATRMIWLWVADAEQQNTN